MCVCVCVCVLLLLLLASAGSSFFCRCCLFCFVLGAFLANEWCLSLMTACQLIFFSQVFAWCDFFLRNLHVTLKLSLQRICVHWGSTWQNTGLSLVSNQHYNEFVCPFLYCQQVEENERIFLWCLVNETFNELIFLGCRFYRTLNVSLYCVCITTTLSFWN